jgi:hypothetical protein
VDPEDRELTMSCGAALGTLEVALRHHGHAGDIDRVADSVQDLLATVGLGPTMDPSPDDHKLFAAISRRHTNRAAFDDRRVPGSVLDTLKPEGNHERVSVTLVEDDDLKQRVAELVAEGDRIQFADRRFRRELASWMHFNRSRSQDGIPGYAQGMGDLRSAIGPLVVRTFDVGAGQAAKDRQFADGSPPLAVLSSVDDDPRDWLATGERLAMLFLRATTHGVSASFLNQPIEVPQLRPRLRSALAIHEHPQLLLRMGYGPGAQPTPRRPVSEVFVH